MPQRSITEVQAEHTAEIMALKGVVGIYQGVTAEGKPAIKVMALPGHPDLEGKIPRELDGYPVIIDWTDEIRPMDRDSS